MRVTKSLVPAFRLGLFSCAVSLPAFAGAAFTYDALGRIVSVRYDDGKQITYTYDPAGNRTQHVVSATTINRAPVTTGDAVTLTEDQAGITFDPRANDSDPDGNALSLHSVQPGDFGTAELTGGGATITYTSSHKRNAVDTVVYTVIDGQGMNSSAEIAVTLANLPPVANNDTASGQTLFFPAFDPRTNDTDPGNDALTITSVSTPAHGTAQIAYDGRIGYQPGAGYVGPDSLTYTISDGDGGTATGTVNITVLANNPPVASNDTLTGPNTGIPPFDPRGNDGDPDGHQITITSVTAPAHGLATVLTGGAIAYVPNGGYVGPDTFTYTISDGAGGSASATVNVTVTS